MTICYNFEVASIDAQMRKPAWDLVHECATKAIKCTSYGLMVGGWQRETQNEHETIKRMIASSTNGT